MNCPETKLSFNDYLDGHLSPDQRGRLKNHLGECVGCRRDFSALESLVIQARQLPAERTPERDLWPGIANQIEESRQGHSTPTTTMTETWIRFAGIAAGLVLLLTLSFVLWPMGPRSEAPSPGGEELGTVSSASLTANSSANPSANTDLERLRTDFRLVLERQKERLAPETLAVVERNMSVIDEAIEEINRALEKDPTNRHLNLLLAAQLQREADLVNQINNI